MCSMFICDLLVCIKYVSLPFDEHVLHVQVSYFWLKLVFFDDHALHVHISCSRLEKVIKC